MTLYTQIIGKMGEDHSCELLVKRGWRILDRNYLRKWGEIDIVAEKEGIINFIEVKTVTKRYICNNSDQFRAEDNIHLYKTSRLKRTVQTYLLDKKIHFKTMWIFSVMVVTLDREEKSLLDIQYLENIII
jgi:putative endonuclease